MNSFMLLHVLRVCYFSVWNNPLYKHTKIYLAIIEEQLNYFLCGAIDNNAVEILIHVFDTHNIHCS